MTNQKNKMKKNKFGAEKKSAPRNKKQKNSEIVNDDFFIGMEKNADKNYNPNYKKTKKLSLKQIKRRKFLIKVAKWTTIFAILIGAIIYVLLSPLFAIKKINVN